MSLLLRFVTHTYSSSVPIRNIFLKNVLEPIQQVLSLRYFYQTSDFGGGKKKKESINDTVLHFSVFFGFLVDLRQHIDTRNRRYVILELQDRLAVSSDVHLIERVLQDIDFVLVGEQAGRWFGSTYVVLVGAVPVAQVA